MVPSPKNNYHHDKFHEAEYKIVSQKARTYDNSGDTQPTKAEGGEDHIHNKIYGILAKQRSVLRASTDVRCQRRFVGETNIQVR